MPLAYVCDRFGGPEVEHFADLPRPVPGPGDLWSPYARPVGPVRGPAVLGVVVELVRTGALDPKVTRVIPFERAPQAVRAVESGHGRGKTVLEMPPLA